MKNIKNILNIGLCTALMLSATSCAKDYLETESTQTVDSDIMFTTVSNAQMALDGVHALMKDQNYTTRYGNAGYQMWMLVTDIMGDDLMFTKSNAKFTTCAQLNWHRNPSDLDHQYFYSWWNRMMGNATVIVNNIDAATGDTTQRDNIKGQALTYRAFCLFYMTQSYGSRYIAGQTNSQLGSIINLTNQANNIKRSTVEECYTQICKDLDEAISLLENNVEARTNKDEIDQWVAKGLRARVALTMGDYTTALKYATDVVENGGFKLDDDTYDYATWQTTEQRMSSASSTEWIWAKIARDDQEASLRHFHSFISNNAASYNKNTPRAINNLLYKRISETDDRKFIWFPNAQGSTNHSFTDPDGNTPVLAIPSSGNRFNYMSNKFLLAPGSQSSVKGDVPYMRLPEMILIKAESEARLGQDEAAQNTLYALAHSRDKEYVLSTNTGEDLIDEILFQRRIELWGEGFRFFDLKRLNVALDRGPAPDLTKYPGADKAWKSKTATTTKNGYNVDPNASNYNMYDDKAIGEANRYRSKDSNFWQFLYPTTETLVNPDCEQNPTGNDGENS